MQRRGLPVKALENRPTLDPENYWLYEAYHMLSRSRQLGGMGEYFIPLTEYEAYCRLFGVSNSEQRLFLINVVSYVDAVLLSDRYKEMEQKTSK